MASADPITEFLNAKQRAEAHQIDTAPMTLATASVDGQPSARIVLLRGVDPRGFAFFTNYNSRKGRELDANPQAALCIHWIALDEQIRMKGKSSGCRPRSRTGTSTAVRAAASWGPGRRTRARCCRPGRRWKSSYRATERQFEGQVVTRPPFWGGFRLVPRRIEFWYGRPDRLHDRVLYVRDGSAWRIERLYP